MRYFTYELIAAANEWITQTETAHRTAEKRFEAVCKSYQRQLGALEPRLSRSAWQFFRYGFGSTGLHDGRLLSLRIGDGLAYTPDGSTPFFLNRQKASAVIEFLNYEQDLHYVFDLRGVNTFSGSLFVEGDRYAKSFGDLYTHELTAAEDDRLRLGFLFASGGSIVVEFKRLVFRKHRIKRKYPIGKMYQY